MSDTPETDALIEKFPHENDLRGLCDAYNELLGHARRMECQRDKLQSGLTVSEGWRAAAEVENAELRRELDDRPPRFTVDFSVDYLDQIRNEAYERAAKVCDEYIGCDPMAARIRSLKSTRPKNWRI